MIPAAQRAIDYYDRQQEEKLKADLRNAPNPFDIEVKESLIPANEIISDLTYASYSHNRRLNPEVSPERWARIFSNGPAMEKRFQQEINEALGSAMIFKHMADEVMKSLHLLPDEPGICTCENNGDLCQYCESVTESDLRLSGDDDGSGLEPHRR